MLDQGGTRSGSSKPEPFHQRVVDVAPGARFIADAGLVLPGLEGQASQKT